MKLLFWTITAILLMSDLTAQRLQVSHDSVQNTKCALLYSDLLPPDFKTRSPEILFYSDSNSTTNADQDYIFKLRLRENCTFFYEVYYNKKDTVRVGFYIGTYTVIKNVINLVYLPMLPRNADKIYLDPVTPVSWTLPKRPGYFLIRNKILIEADKKGRAMTTHMILQNTSEFDIGSCK